MPENHDSNQIRLTRVYDAPVHAVWDAWTVPAQVEQWWGPRGFTLTTHSRNLRPGGAWRYTMHGPGGVDYPNVVTYRVVEPQARLVYDHGSTDDRPPLFRVTVSFSEADGRTTMSLTFTLPSPEAAAEMAGRVKQFGGNATWDRLAEHLAQASSGRRCFVVTRTLAAPLARVFEMWVHPAHLAKWLPPPGTTMRFLRSDIAVGKRTLFAIEGSHGTMFVRAEYLALEPPRRIMYTQQFVDEHEQLAAAPGAPVWPATLLTTIELAEEDPDSTRMTVTCEPHGEVTESEVQAFVHERSGMTAGWTSSFDALEAIIGP